MSKSLAQVALQERTRREVLHRSDHIPPLPENATRILSLLDREDTEPEHLEGLVRKDQVLVAKLLRLVNSPLYGLSREMKSIKDATMVVGFRGLRSLVLASCTAQHLKRDYSVFGFGSDGLWQHSLAVAVAARTIARKLRMSADKMEEMFISGLLHDIGKLVLVSYVAASPKPRPEGVSMRDWELQICGIDHAEAGAMVTDKWQLHPHIGEILKSHHESGGPIEIQRELAVLRLADGFAHAGRYGFTEAHLPESHVARADLEMLGLVDTWSELSEDLTDSVGKALEEMRSL